MLYILDWPQPQPLAGVTVEFLWPKSPVYLQVVPSRLTGITVSN